MKTSAQDKRWRRDFISLCRQRSRCRKRCEPLSLVSLCKKKKKKGLGSQQTEAGACDAMEQQQECHYFTDLPKACQARMWLWTLHLAGSILQPSLFTEQQLMENEIKWEMHCLAPPHSTAPYPPKISTLCLKSASHLMVMWSMCF